MLESEPVAKLNVQAVGEEVAAAEPLGVADQLVQLEADRRIVRSDDGAGTDADDRMNRNTLPDELPQHTDVRRAAQPAGAQDDGDAHRSSTTLLPCAPTVCLRAFRRAGTRLTLDPAATQHTLINKGERQP